MMLRLGRDREQGRRAWVQRRSWSIWSLPRSALAFILATDAAALLLTGYALAHESPHASDILRFCVLLALSVGYAELGVRNETIRRYLAAGTSRAASNPLSVWSFAAVLVLPAGWAAAFIGVQYVQEIGQRVRTATGKLHRHLLGASAAMLAQLAAGAVVHPHGGAAGLSAGFGPSVSVMLAAVLFVAVDLGVVLAAMWLAIRPPSLRPLLPGGDVLGYEFASIAIGIGVAVLLLHTPWLVVVTVAPVAYLHRSAMIKSLHEAARVDCKTGLLNSTAWRERATAALARCARAGRAAAVIVVDIDGFKTINDARGHLVGDQVLIGVAGCLRNELRAQDGVGRFGGDEFVVFLEEVRLAEAEHVAERLRCAVSELQVADATVSVSIGVAHTRGHGYELDLLLEAADTALYGAKNAGRGRVQLATPR